MTYLPFVFILENEVRQSVIAHADAFVGHPVRLSVGGVTGTAEIVVSDKDGVGIILRIADCLMKSNADNCLGLSQLQRSGNAMVNLNGTVSSITFGQDGISGSRLNSTSVPVTVGSGQYSVPFTLLTAGDPRRQSMTMYEFGSGEAGQRMYKSPDIDRGHELTPVYTSYMDHRSQTMIVVGEAFIAESLRSCSAGLCGTAEIAVLDSDGVGVILRITNCLKNPSTHNLLSLSQFQRSQGVFVNLDHTSASIEIGRRGWFTNRLHDTDLTPTILPMIMDHRVCQLPFVVIPANDPRREFMQVHTIAM